MSYEDALDLVVRAFEVLGVGILAMGSAVSIAGYLRDLRAMGRTQAYTRLRTNIGRTILLGLEVLIVADIVLTVAIDQTIESAITLGIIVLVRTFLSFSLEIELEGVVPWHRKAAEADGGLTELSVAADQAPPRRHARHAAAARGSTAMRASGLVQLAARFWPVGASSRHVITRPRRR